MPSQTTSVQDERIRPYELRDHEAVNRLYHEGLLAGELESITLPGDLSHVPRSYRETDGGGFWVAEAAGQVVGMVGVIPRDPDVALLRRLRVAPDSQNRELCCKLIAVALDHSRQHGHLKVILDTHVYDEAARPVFISLGFMYSRKRDAHGRHLLELYINLYHAPRERRPDSQGTGAA